MTRLAFDHVVLAVPDVAAGRERFADTTGCRPIDGGPHDALGTRNAIVAFEGGRYLELIGPDPDTRTDRNFGGRLERLSSDRLLGWAIRTNDLMAIVEAARPHGLDPTRVLTVHRDRPDGTRLEWSMVGLRGSGGAWPFFLDWRDAPHPTVDAPVVGSIAGFEAYLPCDDVDALPFARTDGAVLLAGPARLVLAFESARGVVEWSEADPGGLFG